MARDLPAENAKSGPSDLIEAAHLHIVCTDVSARTLARLLGVSSATTSRIIAQLRRRLAREGKKLVSVKDGTRSYFEIREREIPVEQDPFFKALGFARGVRRPRSASVDDDLYGPVRRRRKRSR